MALYQHSLTFLVEVIFGNISKITHIQHFLTKSFRNGSISNILRKLDCPSKINTWSHVDVWQDLVSFWSKTYLEVQKTHSPAGLDCVLKTWKLWFPHTLDIPVIDQISSHMYMLWCVWPDFEILYFYITSQISFWEHISNDYLFTK